MGELVQVSQVDEGVVTVVLDRPQKKNALSIALRDEVSDVLDSLAADEDVRCVVLAAAGDTFCAGFDLSEFSVDEPGFQERLWHSADRFHRTVLLHPLPTVAAVQGAALAGGFDLAVMCDVRVAATDATFGHPEQRWSDVVFSPLADLVGSGPAPRPVSHRAQHRRHHGTADRARLERRRPRRARRRGRHGPRPWWRAGLAKHSCAPRPKRCGEPGTVPRPPPWSCDERVAPVTSPTHSTSEAHSTCGAHRLVRFPPDPAARRRHHDAMDEATAFLTTLDATAPTAPTACTGWTAHELVAHLTAGAVEMAELTEAAATGRGERATRDLPGREAPFVAMDDDALRARLVTEALRLGDAVEALAAIPGLTVDFSGRRVRAGDVTMHGRSEAALHRWDLAGDDDVSEELLAQPELTVHAVEVLNTMLQGAPEAVTARTTAAAITELRAGFAAPGQMDVVLVVDGAGARLELEEPRAGCCAGASPTTRLLALWGRRSPARTITWNTDDRSAGALAAFLWAGARAAPISVSETR